MWYYAFYAGLIATLGALAFQLFRLGASVTMRRALAATSGGSVTLTTPGEATADRREFIDVELGEGDAAVVCTGEAFEDRCHRLADTTAISPEVDEGGPIGVGDYFLELRRLAHVTDIAHGSTLSHAGCRLHEARAARGDSAGTVVGDRAFYY